MKQHLRFLIGAVFCISALLKLQDPVGLGLIMQDYFNFLHLGFLIPLSKFTGIAFGAVEATIGILLVNRYRFRWLDFAAGSIIVFFTLLTLVLLIVNPDIDCGCFGQAIHLSHAATFIKNLILLALGALSFWRAFTPKWTAQPLPNLFQQIKAGVMALIVIGFTAYPLFHLPLKDFTAFKQGNALVGATDTYNAGRRQISTLEALVVDYDDYSTEDTMVFIYEKDGLQQEFNINNLPDSTWTFVDTKQLENMYDFSDQPVLTVRNSDDEYVEEDLMAGRVLVVNIYKKPTKRQLRRLEEFYQRCAEEGIAIVGIQDKPYDDIDSGYYSDRRTLMTLNRANCGATYLYNGRIISKYASRDLPSAKLLHQIKHEESEVILLEQLTPRNMTYNFFYLTVVILMLI